MRTLNTMNRKLWTLLLVCGLIGVLSSVAAASEVAQTRSPAASTSTSPALGHPPAAAGPASGNMEGFLRALGSGYCQSSCCWASGCDSVSCSDSSCTATCGTSIATYTCDSD